MICPNCGHLFTTRARVPKAERFATRETTGMAETAVFKYYKARALYDDACFLYRCCEADGQLGELVARCARLIMDLEKGGATDALKAERAAILTDWRIALGCRHRGDGSGKTWRRFGNQPVVGGHDA